MLQFFRTTAAVIILGTFLVVFQTFAWQEPPVAPPNENVGPLLNTSIFGQVKLGGLAVNWGDGITGAELGLLVPFGKSGFGTKAPEATLDVEGSVYTRGGSGDIDESGSITDSDALAILKYFERYTTPTAFTLTRTQQANADLDGNGVVTFEDAIMALEMANGVNRETAEYRAYHYKPESCGALPNPDVNGDGKTVASDALAALNMAVGNLVTGETACWRLRADMDHDGRVTASDAARILTLAVGLGVECSAELRGVVMFVPAVAGSDDRLMACLKEGSNDKLYWKKISVAAEA